ncbi:MAG: FtsX-like permease family protein [Candidatus Algichlamydia australiensis]|nr:FtsX-like permease family protein [Chlamydiales bacterium]
MIWFFLAFRNLFRNVRRTLAILLTIAMGAGALFSFDGFITGVLEQYREDTIRAQYGYGQVNTKGYRDKVYEDPTRHWILNSRQVEEFLLRLDGVEQVFPRANFSALLKKGNTTVSGYGQGIEAAKEAEFFTSLNVEEGKLLTDEPNGILLGRGLANSLGVSPGDRVRVVATSAKGLLNEANFVVTGIFHTGSVEFDSRVFRIQLNRAQRLVRTNRVELISLALRDLSDWDHVAKTVEEAYPNLEATSFAELDKIFYQHSVDWLKAQFRVVQIIILSIVLLGIFNTVSTSVLERKEEIGNLRANGESVFSIMRLFLTESAMLALIGSLVGIGLSAIILTLFVDKGILMPPGPGMTRQFLVSFTFGWPMVFYTMAMSVVAALIASFFAGFRVAKMPIAKALRSF